jgi:hypothetical protein
VWLPVHVCACGGECKDGGGGRGPVCDRHAHLAPFLNLPSCLPECVQGKNKPTRRRKKKQENIIEERKPGLKARMEEQGMRAAAAQKAAAEREAAKQRRLEEVPRALHRFFAK